MWLLLSVAHASCVGAAVQDVLPARFAIDVPTNTRVWVEVRLGDEDRLSARLLDEDVEVAATVEIHEQRTQSVVVLTPDALLEPDRTYTVEVEGAGQATTWSFTTGADEDLTPPTGGELLEADGRRVMGSADWNVWLESTPAEDDHGALTEVLVSEDPEFADPVGLFMLDNTGSLFVGIDGPCTRHLSDGVGDRLWFRSRPVDAVGNTGPWSEARHPARLGCSSAPHPAWWGWLAVIALARRRRPRR